jgi:hypothetical protein
MANRGERIFLLLGWFTDTRAGSGSRSYVQVWEISPLQFAVGLHLALTLGLHLAVDFHLALNILLALHLHIVLVIVLQPRDLKSLYIDLLVLC